MYKIGLIEGVTVWGMTMLTVVATWLILQVNKRIE